MREVASGVWHWRAGHPEWKPGQTWDRMVSSYAVETEEGVLLFDPLDVPAELRERASAVVLTPRTAVLLLGSAPSNVSRMGCRLIRCCIR